MTPVLEDKSVTWRARDCTAIDSLSYRYCNDIDEALAYLHTAKFLNMQLHDPHNLICIF